VGRIASTATDERDWGRATGDTSNREEGDLYAHPLRGLRVHLEVPAPSAILVLLGAAETTTFLKVARNVSWMLATADETDVVRAEKSVLELKRVC
jgi:hypothetical protein